MTTEGWRAIGRIAKARRERLGLRQDELADYGGPKVATVGKFERGAATFPLRTQHQIEKALGWNRTIVEQVVNSIDEGALDEETWTHDLVVEDVPDMDRPREPNEDRQVVEAVESFKAVLRLVDPVQRDEALRLALLAILPLISHEGAARLGEGLRTGHIRGGGDGDADNTGGSAPTRLRPVNPLEVDEAAYDPENDKKD